MSIDTSLTGAKPDKLFYVVANVVLVDAANKTCLLLKRGADEKEAGDKWAFPGGKGEHDMIADGRINDFFGVVALAECQQESGLSFDPSKTKVIANGAFVRKDGIPVVWATLAAPYQGGEVRLEAGSFSAYDWFTKGQLPSKEDCIGTVREEAAMAIDALT